MDLPQGLKHLLNPVLPLCDDQGRRVVVIGCPAPTVLRNNDVTGLFFSPIGPLVFSQNYH